MTSIPYAEISAGLAVEPELFIKAIDFVDAYVNDMPASKGGDTTIFFILTAFANQLDPRLKRPHEVLLRIYTRVNALILSNKISILPGYGFRLVNNDKVFAHYDLLRAAAVAKMTSNADGNLVFVHDAFLSDRVSFE